MVICPDPVEARKCRKIIHTGHPGFDLAPIVIDSSGPAGGSGDGGDPYLTVFAAAMGGIDMAIEKGARQVLDAIASPVIGTNRRRTMAIILKAASDAARQTLEALMRTTEYQKTFIDQIYDEGEVKGEVKALLRIFDARGIALTAEQRAQVTDCTDSARLERWLDRVVTATSAAEVLAS